MTSQEVNSLHTRQLLLDTEKKKKILQKVVITDSFVEKNLKSLYSFIYLEYLNCVDLISSVTMNQYFSFILQFHSS